jgi:hypothetical protein
MPFAVDTFLKTTLNCETVMPEVSILWKKKGLGEAKDTWKMINDKYN